MIINKNYFEISQNEIIVIINETNKKINEHIQIFRNFDINYFKTSLQMMKFLDFIYDDSNHKRNTRIKFRTLNMNVQNF